MQRILNITALSAVMGLGSAAHAAGVPVSQALEAAQAAISACKANGYNVTVTILDPDLSTRIVLRADGAPEGTVQIGYRKAYTVIKTGMSSGEFGKSVPAPATPPPPPSAGPPAPPGPVNGDPNLITWAGGLPIKVGGTLLGAMSASGAPGGDKDEACVKAGIAKLTK
jgi:uncharacterized protein GlcG (DUF336 family)